MNNRHLLFLAGLINILMMFLLVHKQNIIIHELYNLQQLQEQKNNLLEQKKDLMVELHTLTKLSSIESYAQENLNMTSMTIKDAHIIKPLKPEEKNATSTK